MLHTWYAVVERCPRQARGSCSGSKSGYLSILSIYPIYFIGLAKVSLDPLK